MGVDQLEPHLRPEHRLPDRVPRPVLSERIRGLDGLIGELLHRLRRHPRQ